MADRARVLVVDDDLDHGAFLAEVIGDHGFTAASLGGAQEALDAFDKAPAEVVVTDIHMPGFDGVRLIDILSTHPTRPALIAITAFGSLDTAVRVLRAGAADYLSKPFQPDELIDRIRHALERRARRLEQLRLHQEVDEILRRRRTRGDDDE